MLACFRRSESAQGAAQNSERRDEIMLFQKSHFGWSSFSSVRIWFPGSRLQAIIPTFDVICKKRKQNEDEYLDTVSKRLETDDSTRPSFIGCWLYE